MNDPLIHTVVANRYLVEERLEETPSVTRYRAEQLVLRKPVAFSLVSQQLSGDVGLMKLLHDEIVRSVHVTSPHVILMTDFGRTENDRAYFVRELVRGQTLAQRLTAIGKLGEEQTVRLLEQLEDALSEMHRLELFQRCVTPADVLISERRGREFARLLNVGTSCLDLLSRGSTDYTAPEQRQAAGNSPASHPSAADLFSLGVMVFQMVTGELPVAERAGWPPSIRRREPWLSHHFDHATRWALAVNPGERPMTVFDFVETLAGRSPGAPAQQTTALVPHSPPQQPFVHAAVPVAARPQVGAAPTQPAPQEPDSQAAQRQRALEQSARRPPRFRRKR